MSGQENPKPESTSRRKIAKAILATPPVLATLTSRPVQAVQGISGMSGNSSNCGGGGAHGGYSHGFWKSANGSKFGIEGKTMWQMALDHLGFTYANAYEDAIYSDVFGGHIAVGGLPYAGWTLSVIMKSESDPAVSISVIVEIQGLLNAAFLEARGNDPKYIMSVDEFWQLLMGTMPLPVNYVSLQELIQSNEDLTETHNHAKSDCPVSGN